MSKGYNTGRAGISRKHALAIVNRGDTATAADILGLKDHIQQRVEELWDIRLSRNLYLWVSEFPDLLLGQLAKGVFEAEVQKHCPFHPRSARTPKRHSDSRNNLQSILEVVSPADAGAEEE